MFKACDRDAARGFHWSWTLCVQISLLVHWKHHCISGLFRLGEQRIDFLIFYGVMEYITLVSHGFVSFDC